MLNLPILKSCSSMYLFLIKACVIKWSFGSPKALLSIFIFLSFLLLLCVLIFTLIGLLSTLTIVSATLTLSLDMLKEPSALFSDSDGSKSQYLVM